MTVPHMGAHSAHMAARRWPFNLLPHPTPLREAPRAPYRVAALLAVAFVALYALTYSATLTSRDGGVMYDTAMAILHRHTLALPPHHHGLPGINGGFYSKYGIAQSLAEIPLLALGDALAALATSPLATVLALAVTMLVNPIVTALCVAAMFLLVFQVRPEPRGAALTAIVVGAASPLWPYAKTDFSEPLSALALLGAALFVLRARSREGLLTYGLAGSCLAIALLAKLTNGFVLPAFGLYTLYVAVVRGGGSRAIVARLVAWALPVGVGLGLMGLYNLARYGSLTDTGYHAEDLPFHAPLLTGLQGLLVGPGKGVLWYCPLVALALLLWPTLVARHRAEALLALGIILPTLLVYATYPVWWGGICWGPRYLVPVLPFVLLPLLHLPDRWPRALPWRRAVVAIIALSVLVQTLGVAVHPARFLATGIHDAQYLWQPADSPLLGHAWLAAYDAVAVVDRTEAAAMLDSYPWRHATGTSPGQRLAIGSWDFWWWQILGKHGLGRRAQAGIAAVLLLLLALALWGLRDLRLAPIDGRFNHRHMAVHL